MGDIIPLSPKKKPKTQVQFYAFCQGDVAACTTSVESHDSGCAYQRQQFLAQPLCTNRAAHMTALKQLMEEGS